MGFLEKFNQAKLAGLMSDEPLFGGLIPRRVEDTRPETFQVRGDARTAPIGPLNRTTSSKLAPMQPMNEQRMPNGRPDEIKLVADPMSEERMFNKGLELKNRQLAFEESKEGRDYELKRKKSEQDERQLDINHRKQALDEWQARNPKGEIKVDKDGNIVVINPVDGTSVSTGIKSGDVSENEKHKWRMEEIETTQNRIDKRTESVQKAITARAGKNVKPTHISPAQQKVAEGEAVKELLNDAQWAHLRDYIGFDASGSVAVQRPKNNEKNKKILEDIDNFMDNYKNLANEKMNKTLDSGSSDEGDESDMVDMVAPDGGELSVPSNKVDEMKAAGAYLVGEMEPLKKKKLEDTKKPITIKREGKRLIVSNK